MVRVGFLQQNAYHKDDTYVPMEKQLKMMQTIIYLYEQSRKIIARGIPVSEISDLGLFDMLTRMKYDIPNDHLELFDNYYHTIDTKLSQIK